MAHRATRYLLLLLAIPCLSVAADFSCIEELTVPKFSHAARSLGGGTVVATVNIGDNGRAKSVKFKPSRSLLTVDLEEYLVDNSRYSRRCSGASLDIILTFQLEGVPAEGAETVVRFAPPNHFILVSHPILPNVDYRAPRNR
jgi:hypothetical protein